MSQWDDGISKPDDPQWKQAVQLLKDSQRVAVFTGAGISAESGIATFRDEGGFWLRFPPDEFANWKGLMQVALLHPARMAEFLVAILEPVAQAEPNPGHRAIAELERFRQVTVITQNIDRLHQDAGSRMVHEIHGTLFEVVSLVARRHVRSVSRSDLREIVEKLRHLESAKWTSLAVMEAVQPIFGAGQDGFHRPNLVLFGDAMAEPAWSLAQQAVKDCDVLITVGTSGTVYPAALLVDQARAQGIATIVIDPETSGGDVWLRGNAADLLPKLVQELESP
ncbi:MAG: iron dicitrate transport regulator FecR [Planctomycetaceae bacterium]|nr:iron dicitrate transport regulator FecR [Planctomycetaceae bacterium]